MRFVASQATCKKCGQGMRMVARIAPMGGSKGLIAFLCSDCDVADTILVDPEMQRSEAPSDEGSHAV